VELPKGGDTTANPSVALGFSHHKFEGKQLQRDVKATAIGQP
jgi:hypothetical protein